MKINELFTKEMERETIRDNWNSGKLSLQEYAELQLAHLSSSSLIIESIDKDIVSDVERMNTDYGTDPQIGEQYIPVQVNVFKNSVILYDTENNTPPKVSPEFLTLLDINRDGYTMQNQSGQKFRYPDNSMGNVYYLNTVFVDSVQRYQGLQHFVSIVWSKSLPSINQDVSENSKYLGPTTKVRINKKGWQIPLNKKGFGSS